VYDWACKVLVDTDPLEGFKLEVYNENSLMERKCPYVVINDQQHILGIYSEKGEKLDVMLVVKQGIQTRLSMQTTGPLLCAFKGPFVMEDLRPEMGMWKKFQHGLACILKCVGDVKFSIFGKSQEFSEYEHTKGLVECAGKMLQQAETDIKNDGKMKLSAFVQIANDFHEQSRDIDQETKLDIEKKLGVKKELHVGMFRMFAREHMDDTGWANLARGSEIPLSKPPSS
jgi:hypothetical protein